ncbi:MAG TPA: hypothetical protein VEF34_05340 [Syntrophobacteraceae bacterium]|nr:hypothetical protein [Syntrophobacteraceae bacterium]
MDMPPPGMVDHPGPNLYETPDYRVDGWPDALPPECGIPDHVEQIVGKASDEKPCSIRIKFYTPRGLSCPI